MSLTDPDARSMATSGRGTGIVGYNVQTAVDAKNHLILAHEVTNVGHDRTQLSSMAKQTREAVGGDKLTAVADRGYFKGEEILECERAGITALVPKLGTPMLWFRHGHARHPPRPARARSPARHLLRDLRALGRARP